MPLNKRAIGITERFETLTMTRNRGFRLTRAIPVEIPTASSSANLISASSQPRSSTHRLIANFIGCITPSQRRFIVDNQIEELKKQAEIELNAPQHKAMGEWRKEGNVWRITCMNCGSNAVIDLSKDNPLTVVNTNSGTGRCLDQPQAERWSKHNKLS
ncbi:hypothetical protein [uncultured Pseudodesulfovibrio sp.]|uniref:hypothetical protein n=1 Tax=uncultured Pseudodesulfovibrio sp. TaxID=2035858 RepID=UPI0029C77648|nr:hypothetical protein [uncultured Pseudodesulfovibrio sp.]